MRKKIEEIVLEGFATSPSRCWTCEARDRKEGRIAEIREANLEHISQLTDEIIEAVREIVPEKKKKQTKTFATYQGISNMDSYYYEQQGWNKAIDEIEKQLKV